MSRMLRLVMQSCLCGRARPLLHRSSGERFFSSDESGFFPSLYTGMGFSRLNTESVLLRKVTNSKLSLSPCDASFTTLAGLFSLLIMGVGFSRLSYTNEGLFSL